MWYQCSSRLFQQPLPPLAFFPPVASSALTTTTTSTTRRRECIYRITGREFASRRRREFVFGHGRHGGNTSASWHVQPASRNSGPRCGFHWAVGLWNEVLDWTREKQENHKMDLLKIQSLSKTLNGNGCRASQNGRFVFLFFFPICCAGSCKRARTFMAVTWHKKLG